MSEDGEEPAPAARRYRLNTLIGRGGMGVVWAATDTLTGREVAIKFLTAPDRERDDSRRRFSREARAISAIRHPNVVEVLEVFGLDGHTPALVMELLRGETLATKLARQSAFSLEQTARLLLPVVSAVAAAHGLGIVHRDLKPDNIFIAQNARGAPMVKVLDFGIAKLTGAAPDAVITQTGVALGTPCYMAPEQAMGEADVDHRADVWSLGAILYQCLSGARALSGDNVGQVVAQLLSTGIVPLRALVPGVPRDVARLVAAMMARDRQRRPADLSVVAAVLGRYAENGAAAGMLPPPTHARLSSAPAGSARSRHIALLSAALALASSLGAWLWATP
jgi:serine/threonine protein kinase